MRPAAGAAGFSGLVPWILIVALAGSAAFAALAYVAGQDGNWDFYNYHYYNPYAYLNDRFWFDIQPAQRQSNITPFPDLPFYWLTEKFGVVTASLAYAVVQSWQLPAIFLIAVLVFVALGVRRRTALIAALPLAVIATFSPLNLQLAGTTTGDSLTATFVMWALAVFLLAQSRHGSDRPTPTSIALLALAGALAGIAVGLKLTNGPYAVALAACVLAVGHVPGGRIRALSLFGLAGLAGFLLAYGYWGWFLYDEFQNPLFPTFNHVFHSEFMKPVQLNDETFKATTLARTVFYPFFYNAYIGAINYQQFLDLRIPLLYGGSVFAALALLFSGGARARLRAGPIVPSLLVFAVVSYLVWIYLFSITRYLLVLEVLTPVALVAICGFAIGRKWPTIALSALALVPLVLSSAQHAQRGNAFGYRTPWADTVFEIEFPDLAIDGSMVLVTGGQAMAFLIPFLPEDTRFVRIDSNLNYVGYESIEARYDNRMGARLRNEIAAHDGDFFVMFGPGEERYVGPDLAYFGIVHDAESCQAIRSKGPELIICRAYRAPSS